jgi:thiamine biosynthesis lipoprotein ApbE
MRRNLWMKAILVVLVLVMIGVSACARPQRLQQSTEAQAPAAATVVAGQVVLPSDGGEQDYISVADEIDKLFQELEGELNTTDTLAEL